MNKRHPIKYLLPLLALCLLLVPACLFAFAAEGDEPPALPVMPEKIENFQGERAKGLVNGDTLTDADLPGAWKWAAAQDLTLSSAGQDKKFTVNLTAALDITAEQALLWPDTGVPEGYPDGATVVSGSDGSHQIHINLFLTVRQCLTLPEPALETPDVKLVYNPDGLTVPLTNGWAFVSNKFTADDYKPYEIKLPVGDVTLPAGSDEDDFQFDRPLNQAAFFNGTVTERTDTEAGRIIVARFQVPKVEKAPAVNPAANPQHALPTSEAGIYAEKTYAGSTTYLSSVSFNLGTEASPAAGYFGFGNFSTFYRWTNTSTVLKVGTVEYDAEYNPFGATTTEGRNYEGWKLKLKITLFKGAVSEVPAAPQVRIGGDGVSLVFTKNTAYEYSIDGGATWQSSPVFNGLTPGQTYACVVRVAATEYYLAGGTSRATNKTLDTAPNPVAVTAIVVVSVVVPVAVAAAVILTVLKRRKAGI